MTTAKSLGGSASRGAAFTLGGQLVRVGIQFAALTILARLLDPSDYGLLAMVIAITGLGEVVRDFGLSHAAIQAKNLSTAQRDNLFWLNTLIGLALTLCTIMLAPVIAAFYGEPRLQTLTMVLSLTFTLNGVGTQLRASMSRDLRMGKLASIDVVSPAVGLGIGVVMALQNLGYWALAGQQLATAASALLGLVLFSGWRPGLYKRGIDTKQLLTFGSSVLFTQMLTYASRNVDSVIIGSQFGVAPLGIYNRAFQLLTLPLNQIQAPSGRVAVPVLAKLQDQPKRYAEFILTGQTIMLHLVIAIFSITSALASPLIEIVMGPRWLAVAPVFQILAAAGVFQAAGYANYWVYLSKALSRPMVIWSLIARPFLILVILIGSSWGMMGVAWAFAIGTALLWPGELLWLARVSDAPARRMFANGVRAILAYACAGVAAFAVFSALSDCTYFVSLPLAVSAWLVTIGILAGIWPSFRRDLIQIVGAIRLGRR